MTLLERSIAGGLLIAVILLLRPLLRRYAPGWTLSMLWTLAALRLLIPLAIPLQVLPHVAVPATGTNHFLATLTPIEVAATTVTQSSVNWLFVAWIAGMVMDALYFIGAMLYNARRYAGAKSEVLVLFHRQT